MMMELEAQPWTPLEMPRSPQSSTAHRGCYLHWSRGKQLRLLGQNCEHSFEDRVCANDSACCGSHIGRDGSQNSSHGKSPTDRLSIVE